MATNSNNNKTATELARPDHWVVGGTTKDGFTVARVRGFFAVLKKSEEGEPTVWAVELITGKRLKAESSTDAGAKGRAFRDAQQAKGVKVARQAAAKKAPAKKAAAKVPAKKAASTTRAARRK